MKKRHKVTTEVDKRIKEIAAGLTPMYRTNANGQVMQRIESQFTGYSDIKFKDGKPVSGNTNFKAGPKPIPVNHYINLIEAYKQKGESGIDIYLAMVKDAVDKYEVQQSKRLEELSKSE